MFRLTLVLLAAVAIATPLWAQDGMVMPTAAATSAYLNNSGSGTSVQPASTPHPMLMIMRGGWTWMLHGEGFLNLQAQSGPRGANKLFSTNWTMGMGQRSWAGGTLTVRSMLSLEPLTITGRRYPELFQTGETAYGLPIVDGQHPHNFFMELAVLYQRPWGDKGTVSIYLAPMGDPAIGPTAFPHRESAAEDPIAPLGHHLEDSTHISADVVTVGASDSWLRWEGSGFHGREPDENRWAIQSGSVDSWASRLTAIPARNWTAQYSFARIASPEALEPTVNQFRETASVMYNRPTAGGNLATTVLWGRTREIGGRDILNGYLWETNLAFAQRNHIWARIENVDKTNELLLGEVPPPTNFVEAFLGRIQAYSFGYSRDLPARSCVVLALGAQATWYQTPLPLVSLYGAHPAGVVIYLRAAIR